MKTALVFAFVALFALASPAAAEPQRGGVLQMIIQPEPPTLISAFTTAGVVGVVSTKMLEGLLSYDLDMNPKPALAEAWKLSPDGRTISFNLRHGVRWHDGKDFTAADVKFSLEEVWKKLHSRGRTTFANVTSVDTPDPYTVILHLSEPNPSMFSAFSSYESQVLPKHIYEGTDILNNPANNAPVGTGPFKFGRWQKGNFIELERNPDYWDQGKPFLNKLVLRIIPDASARAAAMEAGEVQLAGFSPVPLNDVQRLSSQPAIAVETKGYEAFAPMFLFEFNLRRKPFDDKRVRQALAHAIDRDFIANRIWFGFAKAATGPVPSVLPKFYTSNVHLYPYDPKKAEQLLDAAGYKRGPDGKRFKFVHDYLPYGSDYQRTAEYVKQALGRIGVEVELRAQDFGAFVKRVYTDNDFDMTSNYFYCLPDPTLGVQRIYWSKSIQKGVAFGNAAGYADPEMDKVLERIQVENDATKRLELIHRLQQIAAEDLPVLDVLELRFFTLFNKTVQSHTTTSDGMYASFANVWLKP